MELPALRHRANKTAGQASGRPGRRRHGRHRPHRRRGFGHAIVHLFIWHLIWRSGLGLWRIPAAGPFVVVLLIAAITALVIVCKQRGPRWWNNRGGSTGAGRVLSGVPVGGLGSDAYGAVAIDCPARVVGHFPHVAVGVGERS